MSAGGAAAGPAAVDSGSAGLLDALPLSAWHRRLVVFVGLGTFFDLYEVFLGGVLAPILAKEWALSSLGKAAVVSSGFLGMFVGAVLLSIAADRFGRRKIFLVNLLLYSVFSLAAAFAPDLGWFVVLRFLGGLGLGAELVLVDTYLAEFLPRRARGRYTAWAYTVGFVGVPVAALLGGKLVAAQDIAGVEGWRWLLVAGALGALLVLVLRRVLPESPRWLELMGRPDQALAVARSVAAKAGAPDTPPVPVESNGPVTRSTAEVVRTAFSGVHRTRTIMLVIFQILQTVAYYGFGTLAPLVLVSKGYDVVESLGYAALSFAGYPLGSLLSVPLVERVERKWLIIGSAVAIGVLGIVFAAGGTPVVVVLAGFLLTMASNVFSNAFHIYQAEIFPTAIRSTAGGIAYAMSRATAAVMPFVAVPLLASAGPVAVFSGSAVLIVLLCLDVGILGPRSTGRALEEL
ncbi:MFS transporter [Pseudonocardia phyllosphaerae]|uniref:MFS transporter n=1 Tax=Pseudonocardia phyllosphaerae TaxID=3390502 RepID=UPI0039785724